MGSDLDQSDLYQAIQWSYNVAWQAERLAATQRRAYRSQRDRLRQRGVYGAANRYPFHELTADRHYFLISANNLVRALKKIGYEDRMPAEVSELIRIVRNCNEHWDEDDGPSFKRYREAGGTNPAGHRWGAGVTVIGELLEVEPIVELARRIHEDLVDLERS